MSTGRMHLANMFVKTGVQRQGQLVALLLKSLGMVCDSEIVRQGAGSAEPTQLVARRNRRSVKDHEIATAELEALDLLNVGIVGINHLCKLLFANQTAQRILATGEGLHVTADGVLNTETESCNPSLATFIQQTLQMKSRGRPTVDTMFAVRRHSGKRPLVLLVRSLCGWAQAHPTAPAILIFVLDPALPIATDESGLRQLFGFTSTEARLARLLMEGNGLEECCVQLEIRVPTGRKHLGNLFAKTGVQRQGQLISLLLKSAGMLRFQCDEPISKLLIAHDCHSASSRYETQHGR
jgi:DNA-binding CsgD family transcriptional regulator